jgi:hypothetical protein
LASDDAVRSRNSSFERSPSNPSAMRTGESSLLETALSAPSINPAIFQRHCICGAERMSKSARCSTPLAAASALAWRTTMPWSSTSRYTVEFLNEDSFCSCQPAVSAAPGFIAENGATGWAGACARAAGKEAVATSTPMRVAMRMVGLVGGAGAGRYDRAVSRIAQAQP